MMRIREKMKGMGHKRRVATIVMAVVGVATVIWLSIWLVYRLTHITTDAAFVKADLTDLSPLVPGHVKTLEVDEGAKVVAGQTLATLDDTDYRHTFERAEAAAKLAELNFERQRRLHDVRAIPDAKFEEAEAQHKEAAAAMALAKSNLEHATITAPFDGVITKRYADVGDFVAPGIAVYSIFDPATLHVLANLEESKVAGVKLGQNVDLFIDAYGGETLHGKVVRIGEAAAAEFALIPRDVSAGEFTKVTQRVPIKIEIVDREQHPDLRPGLSVSIGIRR